MTLTYRGLASTLLMTAVAISAAYQLYRANLGTGLDVDQFGVVAAAAYAALFGLAVALRTDRRWVWWVVGAVLALNLVYGVVGYYPGVYAARELNLLDWLEGTAYTALLFATLGCTVLRLGQITVAPARPDGLTDALGNPDQVPAAPIVNN